MASLSRLRALARRAERLWFADARGRARRKPIWRGTVLYESFAGNGALDNPEAIFRHLLDHPDHRSLEHIWALGPGHAGFRREFRRHPRVRIVRYRSTAYFTALSRAETLINNATFPPEWGKRHDQRYLNTWHGTPLKTMGYDMPDGAMQAANTLRNFLSADLLLSQNRWMTETMYRGAYRLVGIRDAPVLEVGYPRTDRQFSDDARARALEALSVGGRRLVLVAPTWSGTDFGRPRDEADAQLAMVRDLQARLGDEWLVLFKAHQAVHALVSHHDRASGVLVDNDIPTNVVLGIADHLVTDYSSIFFDFLATGRPVTFYVPTDSVYDEERGTYFGPQELPGPLLSSVDDVAADIRLPDAAFVPRRREWAERFVPDVDGQASDRVIAALFGAERTTEPAPSLDPTPLPASGRPRVLFYLGGMRSNGITSSALSLLNGIDHDAIDVTALIASPRGARRRNQRLIHPSVRQIVRQGGWNGTKAELLRTRIREHLRPGSPDTPLQRRVWADEWTRLFGEARFDAVVDFSGYSAFWARLLLASPPARRSIWLHNDMAAEARRAGAGRRPVHGGLARVFPLLSRFDAIVSVSARLAELNRGRLGAAYGVPLERFVSAPNLIDARRISRGASLPLDSLPEFVPVEGDPERRTPDWVRELRRSDLTWFVSVGRLSPEKNQSRLLAAVEIVHRARGGVRLLVIGDGPLRARLDREVQERGLDEVVVLAGALSNPFPAMRESDCFVLSSDYEGQPMVLLEAALLGLPIVTTRFDSVEDALPDSADAIVVDRSAAAIAAAMSEFIDAPHRPRPIDADAYNRAALDLAMSRILTSSSARSSSPGSSVSDSSRSRSASMNSAPANARANTTTTSAATRPINHHIASSPRENVSDEPPRDVPRDL